MRRLRLSALSIDRRIARTIAGHSSPRLETVLGKATWLGDEKLLLATCSAYWLASRRLSRFRRHQANHLLLTMGITALLPHLLKQMVAQERPDRLEIHGKRRGVPRSGKAFDAFPSGHAMHMGALAAALSRILPRFKVLIWEGCCAIALTRVVLLAHWTSDVVVGGFMGFGTERLLRLIDEPS